MWWVNLIVSNKIRCSATQRGEPGSDYYYVTETEMSSGWLPWSILGTMKTSSTFPVTTMAVTLTTFPFLWWFLASIRCKKNENISLTGVSWARYPPMKEGVTLLWRHNGHDGVSNHQPHDCLLSRLFRLRSKTISKLRVTGLCAGKSPETGEFPAQMASNAENVSIWWRHHGKKNDQVILQLLRTLKEFSAFFLLCYARQTMANFRNLKKKSE